MICLAFCFHAGFLLGLFLEHVVGGDMFLLNVADFQRTTRCYIPEESTLHLSLFEYCNCEHFVH
jgi:hypothetical protein